MFCSKCGKELDEGTAFCPSCGNRLGGMPQTAPSSAKSANSQEMHPEEKKNKQIACMAYFLCMVCDLIFVWIIVGSKGTVFWGSDHPEYVIKGLWDEIGSLFLFFAFVVTVVDIGIALWFYVYAYMSRSFSKYKLTVVGNRAFFGIAVIGAAIAFAITIKEQLGYDSWFMVVVSVALCAVDIAAGILYIKAAGTESYAANGSKGTALKLSKISSESGSSRDDYWVCPKCGSRNSKMSNQCKDCGKYR